MPESEPPGSITCELVEPLGLRISNSEVSRVCALLDEQVEAFRQRPLEGRYRYLFVDRASRAPDAILRWRHATGAT